MRTLRESHVLRPRRRLGATAVATVLIGLASAGSAHAAPPSPGALTVAPAETTSTTALNVTWPEAAGSATAHWALCPADAPAPYGDGPGCDSDDATTQTSATVPTPDEGRFALTVWFEDEVNDERGPESPARTIVIDRTAPGIPSEVRWGNGSVSWAPTTDAGAPVVRAHWKLCRSWNTFASNCVEGTAEGSASFAFAETPIPPTPRPRDCVGFTALLLVWLEDAAGNVDRRRAGGTGIGATPTCLPVADPPKTDPPAGPQATNLTLAHRVRSTGKGTKRRQRVTLTATAKPANASGMVQIKVTGKQGKRKLTRTRNVRLSKGRASFTLTVPKGFRRLSVEATYAGSATHKPSSSTSLVRIPRR